MEPYKRFSQYYDSYLKLYDCSAWFRYLFQLSGLQSLEREKVLDLGCGTGDMLCRFARAGAAVTGVDKSKGMLRISSKKAEGEGAQVIEGDISRITLSAEFGFVYSIGDSVNYLDSGEFGCMLSNTQKMLRHGAALTFDMLNLSYMKGKDLNENILTERGKISFRRSILGDVLRTAVHISSGFAHSVEKHVQYFHEPKDIEKKCRELGYADVRFYEIFTQSPWNSDSEKIQVVALK
ncbi:MAG: class I SAM-dependent methyltransferase [Eubacteriaceae bacterium]|jgi:ubiquinone/menaquinone biosynthesis C-methylase UbiE|nr:class I SAM-dependent methyltransferase [Eubacteriaceae bacterium]